MAAVFLKLLNLSISASWLVLAGLVLCTAYLVDGTYNPFLYFRF